MNFLNKMRGFRPLLSSPPIWGLILCTGFGVQRDFLCPQGFFWRIFLSIASTNLQRENKYDQKCAEENRSKNPCQGTWLACRDGFGIACIKTNKKMHYLCPQYMPMPKKVPIPLGLVFTFCIDINSQTTWLFHSNLPPPHRQRGKPLFYLAEIQPTVVEIWIQDCNTEQAGQRVAKS